LFNTPASVYNFLSTQVSTGQAT